MHILKYCKNHTHHCEKDCQRQVNGRSAREKRLTEMSEFKKTGILPTLMHGVDQTLTWKTEIANYSDYNRGIFVNLEKINKLPDTIDRKLRMIQEIAKSLTYMAEGLFDRMDDLLYSDPRIVFHHTVPPRIYELLCFLVHGHIRTHHRVLWYMYKKSHDKFNDLHWDALHYMKKWTNALEERCGNRFTLYGIWRDDDDEWAEWAFSDGIEETSEETSVPDEYVPSWYANPPGSPPQTSPSEEPAPTPLQSPPTPLEVPTPSWYANPLGSPPQTSPSEEPAPPTILQSLQSPPTPSEVPTPTWYANPPGGSPPQISPSEEPAPPTILQSLQSPPTPSEVPTPGTKSVYTTGLDRLAVVDDYTPYQIDRERIRRFVRTNKFGHRYRIMSQESLPSIKTTKKRK
jgi:hypothetical protein